LAEGRGPLFLILDDVEHIAKVDHIGLLARRVRPVCRVPPAAYNSFSREKFYILTSSTAVVEEGRVFVEKSVA
jgi:hypothetical protein